MPTAFGQQHPQDTLDARITSLHADLSALSQKLAAIEEKLPVLEKKVNAKAEARTEERLRELEVVSARTAEILPSISATNDRLAQLALRAESRALRERNLEVVSVQEANGFTAGFAELQGTSDRMKQIEVDVALLSVALRDVTARGSCTAPLACLSQVSELEERMSQLEAQYQQAGDAGHAKFSQDLSNDARLSEQQDFPQLDKQQKIASWKTQEVGEVYCIQENLWDVSVLIGTPLLSRGESLELSICFLANLVLVILFILGVEDLSTNQFTGHVQEQFLLWRKTVAHDVGFRSALTGESLASGVCNKRLYFPLSNFHLLSVLEMEDYLFETSYGLGVSKGRFLCSLSIVVWYMVCAKELHDILTFLGAWLHVPLAPSVLIVEDAEDNTMSRIKQLSHFRLAIVVIIVLIRFLVAVRLAWLGSLYLGYEINVEDMILNSMALGLMLDLDELLFVSMVPDAIKTLPARIAPLNCEPSSALLRWWNRDGLFIAFIGLGFLMFNFCQYFVLGPFENDVRKSLEALCGGVQGSYDFVVFNDAIGIPWATATTPSSIDIPRIPDVALFAAHAVTTAMRSGFPKQNHLQPTDRYNKGNFMQVFGGHMLERFIATSPEFDRPVDWSIISARDLKEAVGWAEEFQVLGGQDFGDQKGTVYNYYLQYLLEASAEVSCADVHFERCIRQGSRATDVVMRQLCPTRCGCDSPTTGVVSNPFATGSVARASFGGCAPWNARRQTFVRELGNLSCTDTTSRDSFISWAEGVGRASLPSGAMLFDHLVSAFDDGGCPDVVLTILGESAHTRICSITSLPAICPESCGCNQTVAWTPEHTVTTHFCPYSCARTVPLCMTVRINHSIDTGPRGPHVGFACTFPFVYKGVAYDYCTSIDWSGPWCAVTIVEGRSHHWGDCSHACTHAAEESLI